MSEEDTQYENLYEYDPSLAATALFAGLFGISTLYHVWQLTTKKTWYFIPFVVGGLCTSPTACPSTTHDRANALS